MTDFPEAPASVTYDITSKGGFNILFTVRAEAGLELLDTMDAVEKKLIDKGYIPHIRQAFGQKKEKVFVEGKKCPKCGGRIEEKISKAGKKFQKCENGKYDFNTKQNTGCDFVDWLDGISPMATAKTGHEFDDDWTIQ